MLQRYGYLRSVTLCGSMALAIVPMTLSSCKTSASGEASTALAANGDPETIAVLLASHGDIDDLKELESYIKVSFNKNVGIPLPYWARPAVTEPAYQLSVNTVSSQYKIIGSTKYRENSQKQIDALAKALAESGIKAKVYYGFNFTTPFISDAMEQIKKDGIKRIVMFNQGAQCSWASQGENMKDIREYLHEHPEYDAEVLAYREYSNDKRFRDLLHDVIMRDVKEKFPGKSPAFTCVMVASHGLPTRMTDEGDPAIKQMKSAFEYVAAKAKPYKFYHGFLNDDFIPGATWASPASDEVALKMRSDDCKYILLDARLSFTVDHRATLFDLDTEARQILETKDPKKDWKSSLTWSKPQVELASHFDGDPGLAKLYATLTKEALSRNGDLEIIKELGKPVTPEPPVKQWCESTKR